LEFERLGIQGKVGAIFIQCFWGEQKHWPCAGGAKVSKEIIKINDLENKKLL